MNINDDDRFAVENQKIGYTFNARVPPRYRGRRGDGMRIENTQESTVPISINQLWGVDLQFGDQDLTLTVDHFGDRYVESQAQTVANQIDGDGCDQYQYVANYAPTSIPGTTPTSLSVYTGAGVVLTNNGCPVGNLRSLLVAPEMEAGVLGFGANLFHADKEISDQYRTGRMGIAVGFKFSMDQNVATQTVGILTGSTPLVTVANQSGSSILSQGWATSTLVLKQGDIVSFTSSNAVNPVSYRNTRQRRTYTITADVTSDAGGLATLPIFPPLSADATSPFQTVNTAPAALAPIFVYNTAAAQFSTITGQDTSQALAFHKSAFVLATVKQALPGGLDWSEMVVDPKTGLVARLLRGYNFLDNSRYVRFEVLGGWKTVRPELACRISG